MSNPVRTWVRRHLSVIGLGVAISVGGLIEPKALLGMELHFTDFAQLLRGIRSAPEGVTIVAIDDYSLQQAANSDLSSEKFLQQLGQWPWPRAVHGLVLQRLIDAGAAVVGFDLLFDTPSLHGSADDLTFAGALQGHKRKVVVGQQVLNSRGPVAGLSLLQTTPALSQTLEPSNFGLLNGAPDADGTIRRRPSDVAAEFRARPGAEVPAGMAEALLQKAKQQGLHNTIEDAGGRLLDPYGPSRTIPTIPIWEVLESTSYANLRRSGRFKDQIVLIGPTASVLQDLHETVFSGAEDMPGVEIHATELANRLENRGIVPIPPPPGWPVAMGVLVIGLGIAISRWERPLVRLGLMASLSGSLLLVGVLSVQQLDLSLPISSSAAALLLLGVVSSADATVRLQWQRRRLRQSLGRYLSPAVAAEIADQPNEAQDLLGGQLINVVILMSDIRGFTAFTKEMTERGDVRGLVERLNTYFSEVVDAIHLEEGTVDKFIGDATLAVFGAPVQRPDSVNAEAAVRAALSIHERLNKLNAQWAAEGEAQWDQVIALSYGWVVSGNIGSSVRMDYTVIGDAVNTASRLESIAKQCNASIVISDALAQQLEGKWPLRKLGDFAIRGQGNQHVYGLRIPPTENDNKKENC